jgi:hypothetical protein
VADFRIVRADGSLVRDFHVDLRDRMHDHSQPIRFLSISSDGRLLLSAHEDGRDPRVYLAALADGAILAEITWPAEAVGGYPAWSPGGFDGDRITLIRQVEVGSPSPIAEPMTVAWWNPGGAPTPVATFPSRSLVILRSPGQALIAIG